MVSNIDPRLSKLEEVLFPGPASLFHREGMVQKGEQTNPGQTASTRWNPEVTSSVKKKKKKKNSIFKKLRSWHLVPALHGK